MASSKAPQKIARWRALLQQRDQKQDGLNEIKSTPLMTETARAHGSNLDTKDDKVYPQYGLLAGIGGAETRGEMIHYNV